MILLSCISIEKTKGYYNSDKPRQLSGRNTKMDLYIGPLPNHITYTRFKRYFKGYEKHIQIHIRRMTHEGHIITYAFVTTTSERIAKKLMAKFSGKILTGSPVVVREFVHRCAGNERRNIGWREKPWKFFDRRRGIERRRYRNIMEEEMWLHDEEQTQTGDTREKNIA